MNGASACTYTMIAIHQVLSAKIVAKSRARPQNRFGYVSMAAADQADRCIKELNGTELKGRKITVEVV
jgi:RNA recognition motif-containing protein